MQFHVAKAVFDKYPRLLVGLLVCRGVNNGASPAAVTESLRKAENDVRQRFKDPEALKTHASIAAWQEAHAAFGSNPNKFPPSVFALAKRVVKGGELPAINLLVDLYNAASLQNMMPVGGEDLDACRGDIWLTFADGTEPFSTIGSMANEPPEVGEVVYKDDEGALCRKFNWREAGRTCLTETTRNAVIVIEALPPTQRGELEVVLEQLRQSIVQYCGGTVHAATLDQSQPSCAL